MLGGAIGGSGGGEAEAARAEAATGGDGGRWWRRWWWRGWRRRCGGGDGGGATAAATEEEALVVAREALSGLGGRRNAAVYAAVWYLALPCRRPKLAQLFTRCSTAPTLRNCSNRSRRRPGRPVLERCPLGNVNSRVSGSRLPKRVVHLLATARSLRPVHPDCAPSYAPTPWNGVFRCVARRCQEARHRLAVRTRLLPRLWTVEAGRVRRASNARG